MASVSKTVDKSIVTGSETFVYTTNISYSGLGKTANNGKLVEYFPDIINYQLPQIGGNIKSITETPIASGTNVEYNFGPVNEGSSITFTVSCFFGPGREEGMMYANRVKLYADGEKVAETQAPFVELILRDSFLLRKSESTGAPVNAGQILTMRLFLENYMDPGKKLTNIIINDTMPAGLIPDLSFTPVGVDVSSEYTDKTYDNRNGTWNNNTMQFELPKYNGSAYMITFRVVVADTVTPGNTITNVATWTTDGNARNNASYELSVYKAEAKVYMYKYAPLYAEVGAPIQYSVRLNNSGNVDLHNVIIIDTLPAEISIRKIRFNSQVADYYGLYIETSDAPGVYKTVAENLTKNSGVYDLKRYISDGTRIVSIKVVINELDYKNLASVLYMYGMVSNTAQVGAQLVNEVDVTAESELTNINEHGSASTVLNAKSMLVVRMDMEPEKQSYYPLEELRVILYAKANKGRIQNPVFADLLPIGLEYEPGRDYVIYRDDFEGQVYDSRTGELPMNYPEIEVIKDYLDTGRTLVRFYFDEYALELHNVIEVYFGVIVTINPPDSFTNYGYLGNWGNNAEVDTTIWNCTGVVDVNDLDGDGLTTDVIARSLPVTANCLSSSSFLVEKWVKGKDDVEYVKESETTSGGDITYRLYVTNNQNDSLKNIEIVDILPHIGDTGVIMEDTPRNSEFDVYATTLVHAEIQNVLGESINPFPQLDIEYSESNNPERFDETGTTIIGVGKWSAIPPMDISKLAAIKIATGEEVLLQSYERLVVYINAKAPVGVPLKKKAYNSYAVKADRIVGETSESMSPTETNMVGVKIVQDTLGGSIGGFVWLDSDEDGLYDEYDTGVNGITVELYDNQGEKIMETVTANNSIGIEGYYCFNGVGEGEYYIKFVTYGEYKLTIQNAEAENGSKPHQGTGVTECITLEASQIISAINAGVILGPPKLVMSKEGPTKVYYGEKINYKLIVSNTDKMIAKDVSIRENIPEGFVVSEVEIKNGDRELVRGTHYQYTEGDNPMNIVGLSGGLDIAQNERLTINIEGYYTN